MQLKTIALHYEEYQNEAHLTDQDASLLAEAKNNLEKSYSPYSQFQVSAAIRLANGQVFSGANIENAAYPMCLCAERVALAAGSSAYPQEAVRAIAITVRNAQQEVKAPAAPCGACRQVLSEYEDKGGNPIRIILQGETGVVYCFASIRELLPFGFSGQVLTSPPKSPESSSNN